MQELMDVLETRCFDVFELDGNELQTRRSILARGLFTHYFSKIYAFLFKCFRTGFRLDWSYTNRDAFQATYLPIAKRFGDLRFGKVDGVTYYFAKAKEIMDSLALDTTDTLALTKAFASFPPLFLARMPKTLDKARTFRDGEMTMAGLLVFLAPLLSLDDCKRLVDDTTRVFATNISYYQGLHTESLTAALSTVGTTIMEPFHPFFKGGNGTSLNQLSQVIFGDKYPYAQIEKEGEDTYSFNLDLSERSGVTSWRMAGTIAEEKDTFLVSFDPIKSRGDVPLPEDGCAVRFAKTVLPALIPYAERIPPCMLALSFALIWQDVTVNEDFLRTVSSGLLILETGAYWFDDKDRFDAAEEPIFHTALALPLALADIEGRKVALSGVRAKALYAKNRERLLADARYMRLLWAYDLDYDCEMADGKGGFFFYSVDDLATDLSLSYQILSGVKGGDSVYTAYAREGTKAFMALLFAERYTPALEASRRIMDPLNTPLAQWQRVLEDGEKTILDEESDPDIPDSAIKTMSGCGIVFDAYVYAEQDYLNAQSGTKRYFDHLTKVHVKSPERDIFIKGKDSGLKELTFFVTDDQTDAQSLAGPAGEPPSLVKKTHRLGFVDEVEMIL